MGTAPWYTDSRQWKQAHTGSTLELGVGAHEVARLHEQLEAEDVLGTVAIETLKDIGSLKGVSYDQVYIV